MFLESIMNLTENPLMHFASATAIKCVFSQVPVCAESVDLINQFVYEGISGDFNRSESWQISEEFESWSHSGTEVMNLVHSLALEIESGMENVQNGRQIT